MELLFSNTLDEAVAWLAETTGEAWSERRVIQEIIAHEELSLEFVPPRGEQFGIYQKDRRKLPSDLEFIRNGPFRRIGIADYPRFPLRVTYAIDLFEHGETHIDYVHIPADDDLDGRWVIHAPLFAAPLRVTRDMCRVPYLVARRLAAYCVANRRPADGTPMPAREPSAEAEPIEPEFDPSGPTASTNTGSPDGAGVNAASGGTPGLNMPETLIGNAESGKVRTRKMDAPIAQAKKNAADPNDRQSVWDALYKMAASDERPPPLLGVDEGSIKWLDPDDQKQEVQFFTKKNLGDRLYRDRRRAEKARAKTR